MASGQSFYFLRHFLGNATASAGRKFSWPQVMGVFVITEYTYKFCKTNAPVARANVGDSLTFKTLDCFSNLIQTDQDLTTNFNYDSANPATGPVYIEGAEPGDILAVDILSIKVSDRGVVTTLPGVGPLWDRVEIRTTVVPIENGKAKFKDVEIPIAPMVGVIGVAPAGEAVACGFPGAHGGNLDCKYMGAGARLYLPVSVPGALFALGDLHAVMGDGELCGTGLEICGEVTVRFDLIKKRKLDWPVLETKDSWHVFASSLDYTEALVTATRQMQDLMSPAYGWDATDVFFYLSLAGEAAINQGCQPCPVAMILRVSAPKRPGKPLLGK